MGGRVEMDDSVTQAAGSGGTLLATGQPPTAMHVLSLLGLFSLLGVWK